MKGPGKIIFLLIGVFVAGMCLFVLFGVNHCANQLSANVGKPFQVQLQLSKRPSSDNVSRGNGIDKFSMAATNFFTRR